MEDPSYITKPPKRGRGRQDGPGGALEGQDRLAYLKSNSPSGNTTDLRNAAENIDLGGITKKLGLSPGALGGLIGGFLNSRRGGAKLKYPLHNEANHPAKIKFTAYKAKAYTIDPKAIAEIWDVPLLGWGDDKARTLKEGRQKIKEEKARADVYASGDIHSGMNEGQEPNPQTATVGGSSQGGARGNMQSTLEEYQKQKNAEASSDAIKGANIPDQTNIVAKPAPDIPIIELYFPQSLTFNDDVNYNQVDLGPAGLTGVAALNAGKSLLNAVGRGISEGVESIFNLARGTMTNEAAQVAGARATQFIPREGIRAAITTATQTGINPGTRLLFDKPNIRQFSFTFKLIATSAQEADQIESIIKVFRSEMYPETINIGAGIPAGYTFPNFFKLEFSMRGANMKVPALHYCYLRSAQASYNATSMTFHPDGHPTEVDLTLIFQEYRALSKQDVQRGY